MGSDLTMKCMAALAGVIAWYPVPVYLTGANRPPCAGFQAPQA